MFSTSLNVLLVDRLGLEKNERVVLIYNLERPPAVERLALVAIANAARLYCHRYDQHREKTRPTS